MWFYPTEYLTICYCSKSLLTTVGIMVKLIGFGARPPDFQFCSMIFWLCDFGQLACLVWASCSSSLKLGEGEFLVHKGVVKVE